MFDCGIIVLQNKVSSSKILVVLHHHIPGSTNYHTIAMVEKVNYNKKNRESVPIMTTITEAVNLKLLRNKQAS